MMVDVLNPVMLMTKTGDVTARKTYDVCGIYSQKPCDFSGQKAIQRRF